MPSTLLPPRPPRRAISNRVRAFMIHIPWFAIEGQQRLARACGVSNSTICRLIRHEAMPSFYLAEMVTRAPEERLGRRLDMREVFSTDGTYLTSCVCDLVGCSGCFPDEAYDEDDNMRPEYRDLRPSDWCRYRTPEQAEQPTSLSVTT